MNLHSSTIEYNEQLASWKENWLIIRQDLCIFKIKQLSTNTVICTSFDNCNCNIKTVGPVTIDDRVFIKITLNSEFPMYESYESLRSEVY